MGTRNRFIQFPYHSILTPKSVPCKALGRDMTKLKEKQNSKKLSRFSKVYFDDKKSRQIVNGFWDFVERSLD